MPKYPTPQERLEEGELRRKQVSRQSHAEAGVRRRSPIALLEASVRGRVPSLVALKYQLMSASPFAFFRGAVPIMAYDLAAHPHTGIICQLCGDAHVRNLGAFAGVDGRLVFDINDFDETTQGPFEWDLKRLATSLVLAGLAVGSKASKREPAVLAFVEQYRRMIVMFSKMPVIEMARYQVHRLQRIEPISKVLLKAERATPLHTLESLTVPAGDSPDAKAASGARVFKENRPMLTRVTGVKAREVLGSLKEYSESLQPERRHFLAQYQPIDVAFKVVGTGSVGLRDYVVYCEGNGPGDPLFLQIKEEARSAYEPYLGAIGAKHQGRRVVEGQRAMQLQSDPFLGWTTIANRDYLVRQLSDYKGSLNLNELKGQGLIDYAIVCGELLARGHSRSGDACVIAGYIGNGNKFDEAILEFAEGYAEQTQKDWELLLKSKHGVKANKAEDGKEAKNK
ncbi:DUF2252 domain-containing protein [Acidisarcina polymorpha]|nr:DUF2252 domain-containing protein [Acidisarcina polymorpha]